MTRRCNASQPVHDRAWYYDSVACKSKQFLSGIRIEYDATPSASLRLVLLACFSLSAQQTSPAWKRVEHLRHGINASEWLAQSSDYSPQRLRTFTTLDDIARMRSMGFDHVRLSIDPAIFNCQGIVGQV